MDKCGNFNFMQLNATICNYFGTIFQLMQLYATIFQLMQPYCNNFVCNYMQLCNMQLMQLKQLYGTYATLRNFIATYATI